MSDIAFSMTSDERDVIRGIQAVGKESGKLRDQIASLVTQSKEAGVADQQLSQTRLAALNPLLAKQKELRIAGDELKKQLADGKISADEYKTAFDGLSKESNDLRMKLQQLQAQVAEDSADLKKAGTIIGQTEDKTAKYTRAVAELDRMKAKGILTSKQHAAAIQAETDKLNGIGDGADKSGGFIGSLTGKMAGFVTGLGSAATVIAVLKSEYDALLVRQGKSRDTTIDLAAAQSGALDNLDTTMTAEDFAKRMREVSKDLGMSEKDLTVAASSALSAKGDKTASEAIDAVAASAKLNRFAPDQLPAMAGTALDLGKHLQMNPEEALGFLMGTQRTARTVSLKGVSENIAPGIIGGVSMGLQKENAAAVAASLSGTSVDPTGAQTGTTMSALFMQMREFGKNKEFMGGPELQKQLDELTKRQDLEKESLKERFDKASIAISQESLPAGDKAEKRRQLAAEEKRANAALKERQEQQRSQLEGSAPTLDAQQVLQKLQQDPALREKFLADKKVGGFGATFERKMQSAVEQLLTPGTQGFKDYQNALKTQQTLNPQQMFDETVKAKESMSAIKLATQDQKFGNTAEQLRLTDEKGAQSAVIRDRLREIRDSMGKTAISSNLDTAISDLTSGGEQDTGTALQRLEGLRAGLKPKKLQVLDQVKAEGSYDFNNASDRERFNSVARERFEKTAEGKQEALLSALIDEVKAMREDQKEAKNAGQVAGRAAEKKEGR